MLPDARAADGIVFDAAAAKTVEEIANAREATRIAELGYARLIDIARPGMSEDALALELKWHTKTLGAEDNFLLLCAGPRNAAVAPSNGRTLQRGDVLVAEITPSYRGQLAQICRTATLGPASADLRHKYDLLVRAMNAGIGAAHPGAPMAAVCRAINTVLEAEGYGEYCHPPHIRRRGHGLGFGSIRPGDVSLDNDTVLDRGHGVHDPSEPAPAGDRISAVRRAGAADRTRRRTADAAPLRAGRDRSLRLAGASMLAMNPTLLVGPADWDACQVPAGGVRHARRCILARPIHPRPPPSSMATG